MAVRGKDRFENLSAAGSPAAAPPVRFGDYVVPAAVAWISDPIGKSPGVRAEFEMRDGEPICVRVTVEKTPTGRAVTTADLASLPGLDRKGLDAFQALGSRVPEDGLRTSEVLGPDPRSVRSALRGRSDLELQAVADVYRENIAHAPLQAVQYLLNVSERTASRRVDAARKRGLLPPTTPGKKRA